jgi:CheY-like chemotaxis protein
MAERHARNSAARCLKLMVVEDDPGVGYAVSRWLQDQSVRSVLATSTHEAMDMLRDVVFIDSAFDGLLVDYNLGDATGVRVIQQFRDEFPKIPVAVMTGSVDISLELWLKTRDIPLFRKPLKMEALQGWVDGVNERFRANRGVSGSGFRVPS